MQSYLFLFFSQQQDYLEHGFILQSTDKDRRLDVAFLLDEFLKNLQKVKSLFSFNQELPIEY